MVLKLHGDARSTCTERVALLLLEKQVSFTLVPALAGMKSAEYKAKMQPFGQIPVLEDGGYVLFGQWTPGLIVGEDAGVELGFFEQAMAIEATQSLAAERLVHEMLIKRPRGGGAAHGAACGEDECIRTDPIVIDSLLNSSAAHHVGEPVPPPVRRVDHKPHGERRDDGAAERRAVVREISARPSWVTVEDGVKVRNAEGKLAESLGAWLRLQVLHINYALFASRPHS
ncbi:hypothetical protein DFH09DRAFT_1086552 [Mycena vulgaris]|nr:hypothetical protein DFH09DRAFT_1086552 [Mycena vulgaris]